MQNFNAPAGRMPSANGINSKVGVPAGAQGKGLGLGGEMEAKGDNPQASASVKSPVKGFSGGVINPKI